MVDIDDLGRCEACGKYVSEVELKSVEITDTSFDKDGITQEFLWCKDCRDFIDSLLDPNKPTYKRERPERKPV